MCKDDSLHNTRLTQSDENSNESSIADDSNDSNLIENNNDESSTTVGSNEDSELIRNADQALQELELENNKNEKLIENIKKNENEFKFDNKENLLQHLDCENILNNSSYTNLEGFFIDIDAPAIRVNDKDLLNEMGTLLTESLDYGNHNLKVSDLHSAERKSGSNQDTVRLFFQGIKPDKIPKSIRCGRVIWHILNH